MTENVIFNSRRSMLVGIAMGVIAGFVVFGAAAALAQGNDLGVTNFANAAGASVTDIRVIIARIIRAIFGLLGVVAVVIVLYAGFLWMTSGGDEDKIATARRLLLNAVIGLAIMLSAFGITQFILSRLLLASGLGGGGAGGGGGRGGFGAIPFSGALGNGIIETHYPARGAVDVPRNARVMITFKEPLRIASFIRGYDYRSTPFNLDDDIRPNPMILEDTNFKLYRDADGPAGALPSAAVRVSFTNDLQTFVFDPVDLLGSPTENTGHTVSLTGGANGIKKADGDPAFPGPSAEGYRWNFIIGTRVDNTPPQVESVVPQAGSSNPRNTIIEVNFSEPMDPTTLSGAFPAVQQALGARSGSPPSANVEGSTVVGNNYQTVRFVTNDRCGTNACGGDVFCFPGGTTIEGFVRAASLSDAPPAAVSPADGATDAVGNSLDGNADGTADGPATDTYFWRFTTTDVIDLTPPVVDRISPAADEERVSPDRSIEIYWSKRMSLASFTSRAIQLTSVPDANTCFSLSGGHLDPDSPTSKAVINHCSFAPDTNYLPKITEAVEDTLQNCYYPGASNVPGMACALDAMRAAGASYCCSGVPCRGACTIAGGAPVCAD